MTNNEINAKALCDAIRNFSNNQEALDNFESYLSYHFDTWYKKFASTPNGLIDEFKQFSTMYQEANNG